jgi:hypothetical protein
MNEQERNNEDREIEEKVEKIPFPVKEAGMLFGITFLVNTFSETLIDGSSTTLEVLVGSLVLGAIAVVLYSAVIRYYQLSLPALIVGITLGVVLADVLSL